MPFNEELRQSIQKTAEANELLGYLIQYNTARKQEVWLVNPQRMDYFNDALPSIKLRAVRNYKEKLKELTKPKGMNIED